MQVRDLIKHLGGLDQELLVFTKNANNIGLHPFNVHNIQKVSVTAHINRDIEFFYHRQPQDNKPNGIIL